MTDFYLLMNDTENAVRLLVDEDVLADEYLGCHPCVNTASLPHLFLYKLAREFLYKLFWF